MNLTKIFKPSRIHGVFFTLSLVLIVFFYTLYVVNMVRWRNGPDFGWRPMYDSGPNVVAQIFDTGEKAGLRAGDTILSLNDRDYSTFEELYRIRSNEPGSVNKYKILRGGETFEINITTRPIGIYGVFYRSGYFFLTGLANIIIGILVFLMKPKVEESWIFFVMTSILGTTMSYYGPSDLMSPLWLYDLRLLFHLLIPASIIHLALKFPKKRTFKRKIPWPVITPYLISLILFLIVKISSPASWNVPLYLTRMIKIYTLLGIFVFLVSMTWNFIKDKSIIIQLQSKMIFLGMMLAILIPIAEIILRSIWPEYHFPGPDLTFPLLFVLFPLSIGYTIVKYDLFAIDTIIKRTYGYVLTTGLVAGVYALFVFLTNLVFGRYEVAKSPVFPILFTLVVVFLFNPVRNRIQKFIDRFFYRLEYDYQEAVGKISESLRSLLSLDEIEKRIMENSAGIMFIESGAVLLLNPKEQLYEALTDPSSTQKIPVDDLLIQKMSFRKKEVTLYDIQEDPFYVNVREACRRVFRLLEAALIVPMIYEDRLIGLISLGRKKSGKFYRREDIKLLKILANQGAVAVQNARLADQMKSEEMVRANLARYLSPHIVERVIQKDVQVNLGGDKKIVTVLFSDIRGFTRISETLPPDQLVQLLNEYFTEMAAIIFANQGSLDKFIGDAIVAVFGSLISIHNPGRTAVQAAIQMMKTLETANQRWTAQYGFAIHIGIGINTGEVFLGNIGSPERMEFTVIGDTVNIASRLSGAARPGQILITQETSTHLGTDIHRQALPPIEVKGKTGKQEVFEITYS